MRADTWWRVTLAVGLGCAGSLAVAAFAPLLIRAQPEPETAHLDLVCLFLPTNSDWAAHLMSYAILLLLLVGLICGFSSFLRLMARTRYTLRRLLEFTRPVDGALQTLLEPIQLADRLDLVQTEVPLAFCYGLLRPRICLSTGMVSALEEDELIALLWHERSHLLHRDPFRVAFGRAWTAMFFFLPVVRALYKRYLLAKEVDADAYACAQQGGNGPLAAALWVLMEQKASVGSSPRTATAGASDELETRVAWLLGEPRALTIPLVPTLASSIVLLGLTGLELALTHAGVANALWSLSHKALGGC
ncbi:MAG: M56 family metallopeptidase [Chloroflexia bacterium]